MFMKIDYQPIFDYIDKSRAEFHEELREEFVLKTEFNEIKTMIANLTSQVQNFQQEMAINNHRVTRLEDWAKFAGPKIDLPITF